MLVGGGDNVALARVSEAPAVDGCIDAPVVQLNKDVVDNSHVGNLGRQFRRGVMKRKDSDGVAPDYLHIQHGSISITRSPRCPVVESVSCLNFRGLCQK